MFPHYAVDFVSNNNIQHCSSTELEVLYKGGLASYLRFPNGETESLIY